MKKSTKEKIAEMQDALLTIKRLMPEVEAELSLMGGVGAAREKTNHDFKSEVAKRFFKTTKQLSKP